MHWIMPANTKIYNHEASLKANGYIDWKQRQKFEVGDTVYIYLCAPVSKIRFKTLVEKTYLSFPEITDDKKFWKDTSKYYDAQSGDYVRLRLIAESSSDELAYANLIRMGLKGPFQAARRVKEPEIINKIEAEF